MTFLRENLHNDLKHLPDTITYGVLMELFRGMGTLDDITWMTDIAEFIHTRNEIWQILSSYDDVQGTIFSGEYMEKKKELQPKVDAIVAFFQKLSEEIKKRKGLEISIVRSISDTQKVINHGELNLGGELARFEKVMDQKLQIFLKKIGNYVVENDNGILRLLNGKKTHILFDYKENDKNSVMNVLCEMIALGFNGEKILKIPQAVGYCNISVEQFIYQVLFDLFDERNLPEKLFEILFHSIEINEKSVLSTLFRKDIQKASENFKDPYNHFWSHLVNHLRSISTKLNRKEFADAILEIGFKWNYHTQRLNEDITEKKLIFLENNFVMKNGYLILISDAERLDLWNCGVSLDSIAMKIQWQVPQII